MVSATGSRPRLPISTCTCTPSDSQATSATSASPWANSVATSGPEPNAQSRPVRSPPLFSRPLSPLRGERVRVRGPLSPPGGEWVRVRGLRHQLFGTSAPRGAQRLARVVERVQRRGLRPCGKSSRRPVKHLQRRAHRRRQRRQVVAAFQHQRDLAAAGLVGELDQPARHRREAALGDAHVRQRIARVRVEAGRDDHQLGIERPRHGQEQIVEHDAVVRVALAPGQRAVHGRAAAGADADLVGGARARIERETGARTCTSRRPVPRRCPASRCRGGRPSRRSARAPRPPAAPPRPRSPRC